MIEWFINKIKGNKNSSITTNNSYSYETGMENTIVYEKNQGVKNPTPIGEELSNYVISKYFKEIERFASNYYKENISSLINPESQYTEDDFKNSIILIFKILKDDFFYSRRVLRKNIKIFERYLFSQYRHEEALKYNIFEYLSFTKNHRFTNDLRENIKEHILFYNYMGIDIYELMNDFYKFLLLLLKNEQMIVYVNYNYNFEERINNKLMSKTLIEKQIDKKILYSNLES